MGRNCTFDFRSLTLVILSMVLRFWSQSNNSLYSETTKRLVTCAAKLIGFTGLIYLRLSLEYLTVVRTLEIIPETLVWLSGDVGNIDDCRELDPYKA
jgi:hypothetical protein